MPSNRQSPLSIEAVDDRFGFSGGAGALNGLTGSYHLPRGDFCFLSSTYNPPSLVRLPHGSPPSQMQSPSRRGRATRAPVSPKSPSSYGNWQLRAARIVAGHTTWFEAKWEAASLRDLVFKHDCVDWSAFEERISIAWKDAAITFGTAKSQPPDACKVLYVIAGADPESGIKLKLLRVGDQEGLFLATYLCADLSAKCEQLRGLLDIKQSQLERSRSLAGTSAPTPSQVSSSLVNPGRRKRQHEDEGGFEGDDEGEELVSGEPMTSKARVESPALREKGRDEKTEEEDDLLSPMPGRECTPITACKETQTQTQPTLAGSVCPEVTTSQPADDLRGESDDSETQEDLLSVAVRR